MNFSTQKKEKNMQNFLRAIQEQWVETAGDKDGQMRNRSEIDDFHEAVKKGDVETINRLLERSNESTKTLLLSVVDDTTALMKAARFGHADAIRALLATKDEKFASEQVIARDKYGLNALMYAASNGHADAIQALFATKKPELVDDQVKARDNFDYNALMIAAMNGNGDVIRALLATTKPELVDDQVNASNTSGSTALMFAAENGHADVIQALFATTKPELVDAQVKARDNFDYNALMIAAQNGHADVIQALFATKDPTLVSEQVNARNKEGNNALMIAAQNGKDNAIRALLATNDEKFASEQVNALAADILFTSDDSLNRLQLLATNNKSRTPLLEAVLNKRLSAVKSMLYGETNPVAEQLQKSDKDGNNALMLAITKKLNDIAFYILDKASAFYQTMLSQQNNVGNTAFMLSVQFGNTEFMKHVKTKFPDIVGTLAEHTNNAGENSIMIAIQNGEESVLHPLLFADRDSLLRQLTAIDRQSHTALMRAVSHGNENVVSRLLLLDQKLVHAQLSRQGQNRRNALLVAFNEKKYNIARLLLNVDGETNKIQLLNTDIYGENALSASFLSTAHDLKELIAQKMIELSLVGPVFSRSLTQTRRYRQDGVEYRSQAHHDAVCDVLSTVVTSMIPFEPAKNEQNQLVLTQEQEVIVTRSARSLCVEYLCDVAETACIEQIGVDATYALFTTTLHEVANEVLSETKRMVFTKISTQATSMFTKTYYGLEYMLVYGNDGYNLFQLTTSDDLEMITYKQYVEKRLSEPLTEARIERFLARHLPDNSPHVRAIERRISKLQLT